MGGQRVAKPKRCIRSTATRGRGRASNGFANEMRTRYPICMRTVLSLDDIASLSPEERLSLIEQLWDSLHDADIPLTDAQKAELERRLATLEEDRAHAVPWEQLKAELAKRCP
jgi:putative addiction module component (TIGR02574 family)